MLDVFRASGFPLRLHAEPGAMIVEFPTELTGPARERFERREQTAAAAAVRALLHPASVAVIGVPPAGHARRRAVPQPAHGGFTGPATP